MLLVKLRISRFCIENLHILLLLLVFALCVARPAWGAGVLRICLLLPVVAWGGIPR